MDNFIPKILFLLLIPVFVLALTIYVIKSIPKKTVLVSPLPLNTKVQAKSPGVNISKNENTPMLLGKSINILILGLDGRRGDGKSRCDAIHMISYNHQESSLTITSVPRGTTVNIPGADPGSSYIGNSCHIMGIKYAVSQIEKITGIHPDAVVKIGFSQAQGILRLADLFPADSLQFLRNRSVPLGDYQRSHNQALFIKDMIIKHLKQAYELPKPMKYIAYKMLETDLPYETALSLLEEFYQDGIDHDPAKILLAVKPENKFSLKNTHLDDSSALEESAGDDEFNEYQQTIITYLRDLNKTVGNLIGENQTGRAFEMIKVPFLQKLWLQIEDEKLRNALHLETLQNYSVLTPDKNERNTQILDFVTEMEEANQIEYKNRGQSLLDGLN